MNAAIDDIAFLGNSENRVTVIETLADTPQSRNEILDRVDASRVTVRASSGNSKPVTGSSGRARRTR